MKNIFIPLLATLCFFFSPSRDGYAQMLSSNDSQLWNGKECAVVLSYDDAIVEHLTNVIPALDAVGLKGTFYLNAIGTAYIGDYINDWREAAKNGHELGNHTMVHPCAGNKSNTSWVNEQNDNDLNTYSLKRIVDDIRGHNALLKAIDGRDERTFAYPCGDNMVSGNINYFDVVKDYFVAARAVQTGMVIIDEIDFANIPCFNIQMQPAEYMIDLIEKAARKNALIVFMYHGVGGGHDLNASLEEHNKLLNYLKENKNRIWTSTFLDAAKNAKAYKNKINIK